MDRCDICDGVADMMFRRPKNIETVTNYDGFTVCKMPHYECRGCGSKYFVKTRTSGYRVEGQQFSRRKHYMCCVKCNMHVKLVYYGNYLDYESWERVIDIN